MQGGRVILNGWQRVAIAVGSAVGGMIDPRRTDLVAAVGETTGEMAFERVLARMKNSPEGRQILLDRPHVVSSQILHAKDMPGNTFGARYANFMISENLFPNSIPVRFIESEEVAYVATRAQDVHDYWHTLFGLRATLASELALKAIEFQQMQLPLCAFAVAGGSTKFKSEKLRGLFFKRYLPWALRAGLVCDDLMCIYYEKYFEKDLEELRRKWGIEVFAYPKK